jgi:hypothetical protein
MTERGSCMQASDRWSLFAMGSRQTLGQYDHLPMISSLDEHYRSDELQWSILVELRERQHD